MPDETPDLFASDLERRALAHLPAYRPEGATVDVYDEYDEQGDPVGEPRQADLVEHMREAGGHPEGWEPRRSLTETELLVKLAADEFSDTPTPGDLRGILKGLESRGYVESAGDSWAMTATGLEALTA